VGQVHNWINECGAVDGRILKLLEASGDEVFIEEIATNPLDALAVRNIAFPGAL
jgi:hypothetical protein